MAEPQGNREHKDRLFLKVFEDREALLSLYNAVNDSNYENPDDLEITTLDNVLVSKIRENLAKGKTLEGAIEEAIRDCLNCGFLTELLTKYRQEVIGMLLTEYDEKRHLKNTYEQLHIKLPWKGDFDTFMSDKNNRLVFE